MAPGELLVARDLRGDDGRLLSELVVRHRLPELSDADFLRDAPLHHLLGALPGAFWSERWLDPQGGDPSGELYIVHRYLSDGQEADPASTAVGLQAFHDPAQVTP